MFEFIILVIFSFVEYTGYVTDVSKILLSQNKKEYYDVQIHTGPEKPQIVRFMVANNPKRELLIDKYNNGQPVRLTNLNPTDYCVVYFNLNKGSQMKGTHQVSFKCPKDPEQSLESLKNKPRGSTSTIRGQVKCSLIPHGKIASLKMVT